MVRIGVWGFSGGGTLASLLGVAGSSAGFDHGRYADQSSAVQAVVDMFGAADLTDLGDSDPFTRAAAQVALGSSMSVRRSASPSSYLGAGTQDQSMNEHPPFLVIHGTADQGVRPRQSQAFAQQLRTAGVPVELMLVQGADHGLDFPTQQPTPGELTQMVTDFFTRYLNGSA